MPTNHMQHVPGQGAHTAGREPCANCGWQSWSEEAHLCARESARLDEALTHHRTVRKGERLYHSGADFESIHAVHSGFLKSTVSTQEGTEQIVQFALPGDIVGLDGIATGRYQCTTVALEDSSVCGASYVELMALCGQIPALQRHFSRLLATEVGSGTKLMVLLAMGAEARVAAFLLRLASRLAKKGYSATQIRLPMTRQELGSHLGLRLETVSRIFSTLRDEQIIAVEGREIRFKSLEALRQKIDDTALLHYAQELR